MIKNRNTFSNFYSGSTPLVCGVRMGTGSRRRRQADKPEEDKRIVGGSVVASDQDWPWQAGLKDVEDNEIFCGGSLINNQWILTAAHCINDIAGVRKGCASGSFGVKVVLGEFDVRNVDGHEVDKGKRPTVTTAHPFHPCKR